ncbi:MAG: FkbM family methyltransferase [Terriglobales bacterium]
MNRIGPIAQPGGAPELPAAPENRDYSGLRRWLGPLGRYRPGVLRHGLAQGFRTCDWWSCPHWARLFGLASPEERLLLGLSWEGKVVYDIGAHSGAYTLFFARRVGLRGQVVAFEPQPRNFRKLTRNLRLNRIRNARGVEMAVGRGPGRRSIFMLPCMTTTASLAEEADTPLRWRVGQAEVAALDALIGELRLPPPQFVKIDVEGMEGEVIEGAAKTLDRWRPELLIEMHGLGRAHRLSRAESMVRRLMALGYTLVHAESATLITTNNAERAAIGHLYAY